MMELDDVLAVVRELAPPALAARWDNTGLLIRGERSVSRMGLCIDLTEPVLDEMEGLGIDLVLAYHPVIFSGLKRLSGGTGTERVVARLLRAGMHVYCPHTALDAARDGMGDWLAAALGPTEGVMPIEPTREDPEVGMGRRGRLVEPAPLRALLPRIQAHLGLKSLRVAGDLDRPRRTFAVCPGAGAELFDGMGPIDLILTGEMRHHSVLPRVAQGEAVVLTDHTNCERGFLPVLAERLRARLPGVELRVSEVDADPLLML